MKIFINRLKIWFSYWKLTENLIDYEYSCILRSEMHHLKMLYNGINKCKIPIDAKKDLQRISLCIKLLEIVNDDLMSIKYPKCNINNFKRFSDWGCKDFFTDYPGELYQMKAWYLYNEIRKKYIFT